MRKYIEHFKKQAGFTLIEMAVVLVIIGAMAASGLAVYKVYLEEERYEKTESVMVDLVAEIGDFRSVYGRYPCPAEFTAAPGDLTYGLEETDCRAANYGTSGACSDGICTATSANVSAPLIVIGTLPWKSMGLRETDVYDGNGNKVLYAVTGPQTSSATFAMNAGGIGLNDSAGGSIITPPDTAHFVVISHGNNGIGAYSRSGAIGFNCNDGPLPEQENCDNDNVFVFMPKSDDFDDRVQFFTPSDISYWEKSTAGSQNIYLRDGDGIAVGANVTDDLTTAPSAEIRITSADSGIIWAQNSNFITNSICNFDPLNPVADCFSPALIGGLRATGGGMECASDEFMAGLENASLDCEDEIFVACPTGSVVSGVDASGRLLCRDVSMPSCSAANVVTSCGQTRALTGDFHGNYRTTLSGQCHYFQPQHNLSAAAWAAWFTLQPRTNLEVDTLIAGLNDQDRVMQACETTETRSLPGSALVRDTFRCDMGNWVNNNSSHERRTFTSNFPASILSTTGASRAETNGPAYTIPYDRTHTLDDHDCWCREDWRVTTASCGAGYALTDRVRYIQKHRCPSSAASWQTVYEDRSGCGCVPGTSTSWITCNQHYNVQPGYTLDGYVSVTRPTICVAGVSVVDNSATPTYDTSGCYCANRGQAVNITYCPPGYTNTYTIPGEVTPRTGIQAVSINRWICPAPVNGVVQPGYWQNNIVPNDVPPCVCDPGYYAYEYEACPPGLEGAGKQYRKEWVCALNDFEPPEDWELITDDCNTCTWKSERTSSYEDTAMGRRLNSACSCGDTTVTFCYDNGPGGKFEVWPGCQCSSD